MTLKYIFCHCIEVRLLSGYTFSSQADIILKTIPKLEKETHSRSTVNLYTLLFTCRYSL